MKANDRRRSQRALSKFYESRMKSEKSAYNQALESIQDLYSSYSIADILTSLFVSSVWLPNIASLVTHQFYIALFASVNPALFSKDDRINSYTEFSHFLQRLYDLAPRFRNMSMKMRHFHKTFSVSPHRFSGGVY